MKTLHKICSRCKVQKGTKEFAFQNKIQNKFMSACKVCMRADQRWRRKEFNSEWIKKDRERYNKNRELYKQRAKEYRKRNPEKVWQINLKRNFGITTEQYNKIKKQQNNQCGICGRLDNYSRNFAVDHDHITGEIRGLLCTKCNTGLGHYELYKNLYVKYLLSSKEVVKHILTNLNSL